MSNIRNNRSEIVLTAFLLSTAAGINVLIEFAVWWIPEIGRQPHHWFFAVRRCAFWLLLPVWWYLPVRLSFGQHRFSLTIRWGLVSLAMLPFVIAWYCSPTSPFTDNPLEDRPALNLISQWAAVSWLQIIAVLPVMMLLEATESQRGITALPEEWGIPLRLAGLLPILAVILDMCFVQPYWC